MEKIIDFLDYSFAFGKDIKISIKAILIVTAVLVGTSFLLKLLQRVLTKRLPRNDKEKFITFFNYIKWLIYIIIVLMTLSIVGVNVTAIFATSAALLIGIGLALQTLFQDIISGVFILIDQTVHVGDIIEIEGKVGKIVEINLRTTRTVTMDNKVLIIPNHLYLINSLYNWTENGIETRENVNIGVAYGSDVEKVRELLLAVAEEHSSISKRTKPDVLFMDFADSSLQFRLLFTIEDSYVHLKVKSDLRYLIDKKFRENNIEIPFPQRDVHFIETKK